MLLNGSTTFKVAKSMLITLIFLGLLFKAILIGSMTNTIFAVAGEDEEEKLISLQQSINEDNQVISLMQFRDESLAFVSLIDQVLP